MLALMGIASLAACQNEPVTDGPVEAQPIESYGSSQGKIVTIDAKTLLAEVLVDADAANARYKDATLRVSGKVVAVDHSDRTGITVVQLEDGHLDSVLATLDKGTQWQDIEAGQLRTFECTRMEAYLATVGFNGKCKPI